MRILFASNNLPVPPTSGGAQRTALLLEAATRLGSVDAVFLTPSAPKEASLKELRKICRLRGCVASQQILRQRWPYRLCNWIPGLGADIAAWLDAGHFRWRACPPALMPPLQIDDYDLIIARYLQTAATLNLFTNHTPIALDVDDYDPDRLRLRLQHASLYKRLTLQRTLRTSTKAHASLLPRAHHLWVANPEDLQHHALRGASLLENVPWNPPSEPPPAASAEAPPHFLMVGTMSYSANRDGVAAFLQEAWPIIRARHPDAHFDIVGGGVPSSLGRYWQTLPGVSVHGFVDDLYPHYARSLAVVAPILAGAGTNIKVLEAAYFARPSVLTQTAHRGFAHSLPTDTACLAVPSITAMADACTLLMEDRQRAQAIGMKALQGVREHHSRGHFLQTVERDCASLLGAHH